MVNIITDEYQINFDYYSITNFILHMIIVEEIIKPNLDMYKAFQKFLETDYVHKMKSKLRVQFGHMKISNKLSISSYKIKD